MPYDFAPAYIAGNAESKAAVDQWMAENFGMTNPGVEATRRPNAAPVPIAPTGVGGLRGGGATGGYTYTGDPRGTVDPEALRILAQGGKYTDQRDKIAEQVMANSGAAGGAAGAAGAPSNMFTGPGGVPLIRPPTGAVPPGMQRAWSPLIGLMGEGDNTGFMQGYFSGGA